MSQIQKLKDKFFSKPIRNDMTHDEVGRLAAHYGCEVKPGGKHQMCVIHKPSNTIIPIPCHGKCVKEAYIKQLKDLFLLIEEENY